MNNRHASELDQLASATNERLPRRHLANTRSPRAEINQHGEALARHCPYRDLFDLMRLRRMAESRRAAH
jgi:hypothetical protein